MTQASIFSTAGEERLTQAINAHMLCGFDFDGTLSLIREGWPVVMLGMFQEMLPGKGGAT